MLESFKKFPRLEVIRVHAPQDPSAQADRFAKELFAVNSSVQVVKFDQGFSYGREAPSSFQIARQNRERQPIELDPEEWLHFALL